MVEQCGRMLCRPAEASAPRCLVGIYEGGQGHGVVSVKMEKYLAPILRYVFLQTGKSTTLSMFLPALIHTYGFKDHMPTLLSGNFPEPLKAGEACVDWVTW